MGKALTQITQVIVTRLFVVTSGCRNQERQNAKFSGGQESRGTSAHRAGPVRCNAWLGRRSAPVAGATLLRALLRQNLRANLPTGRGTAA